MTAYLVLLCWPAGHVCSTVVYLPWWLRKRVWEVWFWGAAIISLSIQQLVLVARWDVRIWFGRLPPTVVPHNQQLAHLRYKLISRGMKDGKYLPFSLHLQAEHANTLTLPQTSYQATILANSSLVKAHHILQPATKNNFNAPHGKPPDKGQKIKRPTFNRPPKSNSEITTSNKYKTLDSEADDCSTSELDFPNPFS